MKFRLSMFVFCLLLVGNAAAAAPCARVKSPPDAWVATKVDALVLAARLAYENEKAQTAYDRVIKGIADTLRQCKLSGDETFLDHHREFVEFIDAAFIAQQPDHELGFIV